MNNQIQLVLKSSTTELSLNDHELGIYLVPELDGLTGLPEIRTTSGVNSGYDGGWTSAQHYDARSITIRGVIANTDVATVERLRKQLVSLAGQGKQEELTLDLVTEAGNAYTLQVRTIALEMAMKGVLEKQEFMLQLRADDPLIYDNAESTHEAYIQVSKATGGFTINFDLPLAITGGSEETVISNDGLEQVPTITRLYGELHNPKIINQTTNQSMQINADLGFSEGQWVDASEVVTGKTISIEDAPDNAPLASFRLDGETSQNGTPTPSTPVPVNTVTGENVVKICGKNLFNTYEVAKGRIDNGVIGYESSTTSLVADDNSFTFSVNAAWRGCASGAIPVKPNTAYYFKATASSAMGGSYVDYYNSDGWVSRYQVPGAVLDYTFTTPNNCSYVRLSWQVAQIGTFTISSPQLELGSTATAYEPYQGQSYEINLGKNLFDKETMTLSNVSASPNINSANGFTTVYIPCEPNTTYTVQKAQETTRFFVATTEVLPAPGVQGTAISSSTSGTVKTFTTGASAKYIAVMVRSTSDTLTEAQVIAGIQIEKGSQATSYAAYFEPIELGGIGDDGAGGYLYKDGIYKNLTNNKWYVHKETANCPLNSTNASFFQLTAATGYADLRMSKPSIGMIEGWWSGLMLATNFSPKLPNANMQPGKFNMVISANNVSFALPTTITTLQDAKNYMDGLVGSKIYYVLATPTDTEITNEALIAQLETLLNIARTYAGVNNIFTITPNEQGTLEISYYTHKTADNRDEIVIDSRLRTVTLNGLDIYHLIETGSEFLMLAPGENKLSLQSDITGDNGYAEVSYKQGYLSI